MQGLRGLAAVGVLLSHLYVIEAKYSPDTLLGPWARLGMAGVDLFFVISGFIMVYVTWNMARGASALAPFLWRRATRIYPLYWIVSLAVLAVWLWRPDIVFASNPDPDIVKSFLLIPQQGEPLLTVGWTLIHEMYFYLVFALILLLPRKWMGYALGAWCVGVAGVATFAEFRSPTLSLVFSPLVFEFVAGAALAMMWLRSGAVRLVPILAALGVIVVGNILYQSPSLDSVFEDHMARAVVLGPFTIAAFAIYALSMRADPGRTGIWLGDISYSLYLTHVLTLSLVGRLAAPFLREGIADNILLLVVMVGASLAVAHLTYILIERPLIRLFRRRRTLHPSRAAEPASD